ncbi:S-layer homology domain-containing protein [Psychrobacillus sp. NPDC096623]|uniref:S-layer homology domain-containing protein n=1 Tax=Psychrobacillus sp. NPDC096623 TaxID=3364492 RepID=UPI003815C976
MKKLVAIIIALSLVITAYIPVQAADELTGLTLEKEMRAMIELGIIQGYNDGTVRPKDDVTREQFAAFIVRALKLPAAAPNYTDVNPSSALASAIGALQSTGIMKGTLDNKFNPTKKITREEMAITMARVLDQKNITVSVDSIIVADQNKFGSSDSIIAAKKTIAAKIINGFATEDKTSSAVLFKPKDLSKRDQVSAVIYRFIELMKTVETPEPMPEPIPTPEPVPTPPPVEVNTFYVASVKDGEIVKSTTSYKTFEEASKAFSSSSVDAILKGDDMIKIKSGLAYSTTNPKNYASIYSDTSLKTEITYIQKGREMKYIGSGPDYVIVQAGGTIGYAKHSEVDLIPSKVVIGQDYYSKNGSGMLNHYLYNHVTKKLESFYQVGPAPDFMNTSDKYYSYDGVQFYDNKGTLKGTFFPYFQFQSVRQPTNYTAEELDQYILTVLTEKEATKIARYANAVQKSKLVNLGTYLKEVESTYEVNAMFILAAAMHESDFGLSSYAQTINNLFGIGVYDSDPNAKVYAKPENSVYAFVTRYINGTYGLPTGSYANGAVPGNKTTGFNVKYASDPQWGSKIAGHMYRIDSALGGRDFGQAKLGITTPNSTLNVRSTPEVNSSNLLYTYKRKELGVNNIFGYPVVIISKEIGADGYYWYKVLTDTPSPSPEYGWIRGDLLRIIE